MAIVTSVLTAGSNNHTTSSEEANGIYTDFVSQGIIGTLSNTAGVAPATGGYSVNAQGTPDTTIAVSSGVAYVTGTPTSQNSQRFRVKNSASTNTTISANVSGSTKYDWVYIKLDATKLNTPNTAGDDAATIVTSRSSSASSDDGTPPTYGINIAVVTVANGFTTITNSNIRDTRASAVVSATSNGTSQDWYATGLNPSSVTALGNRSYSMVFNSINATTYLSPGMRLKATRLVAAPTQCTSLNGTTQFYSKASPAGMTFTDDFVVSAWVKLSSYPSTDGCIASRYNGTSGWQFYVGADGTILLVGRNGGTGNNSYIQSYQSIPLNKWVHISAQLDMSTFTATTTTSYIMIDGVDIPAKVVRNGTNPTTLVQLGNLEIGSYNGGAAGSFFPGKIAQVAIYNAKVTQATILASMHQTLTGSETSLISAYSFNGIKTDLNTSNANNLTANGSAVETTLDTPFTQTMTGVTTGTTNYGIITAASFSTNTTLTVQVAEGDTIPTSGGVSAISYSTQKTPYGFPGLGDKWDISLLVGMAVSSIGTAATTTYAFGATGSELCITLPIGSWDTHTDYGLLYTPTASIPNFFMSLSTATNAFIADLSNFSTLTVIQQAAGSSQHNFNISRTGTINLASATKYYPLVRSSSPISLMQLYGGISTTQPSQTNITSRLTYL